MRKNLFACIALVAAATPGLHAAQFEGQTQLIDDPAIVYSIMPGTYAELKGDFDFNCQGYFNAIYNQTGMLINRNFWIIDENNEIVYDAGKLRLYGTGMRNFNYFGVSLTGEEVRRGNILFCIPYQHSSSGG